MNITRSCRYPGTGYPESSMDSPEELGDNASICFIFVLSPLQYEIIKRFSVSIQSALNYSKYNSKALTQQQQQKTTSYSSSLT